MTQCTVMTAEQRQLSGLIKQAEHAMMVKIIDAIRQTTEVVEEGARAIPADEPSPHFEYFMAVTHRELLLRLCHADPVTGMGGDPVLAAAILQSDRNFVAVHWEGKSQDEILANAETAATPNTQSAR